MWALPAVGVPSRAAALQFSRQRGHLVDLNEAVIARPEVPLAQGRSRLLAELVRPDWKRLLGDALKRLTPDLVVVSGLDNFDFVFVCSVHQPMFVVDPAGPVS